jgi:NAD(P)-dependent dehydrogenase (short-subunit alcohol dehydrogenase family)
MARSSSQTKALLPLLKASPFTNASRIVWTSSFLGDDSPPIDFNDLQCVETLKSYDVSKRQVDLLAASLDKQLRDEGAGVRSLVADPAVTATEIFRPQLGLLLYQLMMFAFYFVSCPACCLLNVGLPADTVPLAHIRTAGSARLQLAEPPDRPAVRNDRLCPRRPPTRLARPDDTVDEPIWRG